jgi:uncharacterized protein (DUF1697 family)
VTAYVALLRAVNVGGRNSVSMAALREALAGRGLDDVSTVLQSGNVLFSSSKSEAAVAKLVQGTIAETFGIDGAVVVRSAAEVAAVAAHNPFLQSGEERDPKTLHVAFLEAAPARAAVAKLDPVRSPPDAFDVRGREVYLSYPDGSGRSKLTLAYLERVLGVEGTARNWRTVERIGQRLAELLAEG